MAFKLVLVKTEAVNSFLFVGNRADYFSIYFLLWQRQTHLFNIGFACWVDSKFQKMHMVNKFRFIRVFIVLNMFTFRAEVGISFHFVNENKFDLMIHSKWFGQVKL